MVKLTARGDRGDVDTEFLKGKVPIVRLERHLRTGRLERFPFSAEGLIPLAGCKRAASPRVGVEDICPGLART